MFPFLFLPYDGFVHFSLFYYLTFYILLFLLPSFSSIWLLIYFRTFNSFVFSSSLASFSSIFFAHCYCYLFSLHLRLHLLSSYHVNFIIHITVVYCMLSCSFFSLHLIKSRHFLSLCCIVRVCVCVCVV